MNTTEPLPSRSLESGRHLPPGRGCLGSQAPLAAPGVGTISTFFFFGFIPVLCRTLKALIKREWTLWKGGSLPSAIPSLNSAPHLPSQSHPNENLIISPMMVNSGSSGLHSNDSVSTPISDPGCAQGTTTLSVLGN